MKKEKIGSYIMPLDSMNHVVERLILAGWRAAKHNRGFINNDLCVFVYNDSEIDDKSYPSNIQVYENMTDSLIYEGPFHTVQARLRDTEMTAARWRQMDMRDSVRRELRKFEKKTKKIRVNNV